MGNAMKEKRKLSPGDRIKFVGWAVIEGVGAERFFADNPEPAVVDCLVQGSDASLRIKYRGDTQALIHRRQVVSILKPKKAPAAPERERVECWATISAKTNRMMYWGRTERAAQVNVHSKRRVVHMAEIREGERILSLEDLKRAWDTVIAPSAWWGGDDSGGPHFNEMLQNLGFREEREP